MLFVVALESQVWRLATPLDGEGPDAGGRVRGLHRLPELVPIAPRHPVPLEGLWWEPTAQLFSEVHLGGT